MGMDLPCVLGATVFAVEYVGARIEGIEEDIRDLDRTPTSGSWLGDAFLDRFSVQSFEGKPNS